MSTLNASIQGRSTPASAGTRYDNMSIGSQPTHIVDSSNPFYTTKVENLTISATTYTAGNFPSAGTIVFTFSGSPDLSEVMVNNYLKVIECGDIENEGEFRITAVDNSAKTITVSSVRGKTNGSATGKAETMPFYWAYSLECVGDTTGLAVTQNGDSGASLGDLTAGLGSVGEFTEVTIATSGKVILKLA